MYRIELDGLRAFAVIAVLVNHANTAWLPSGFLGVDCFFLLSGYVVSRSWSTRERQGAICFYQRRLRRLQPALLSMVFAVILLAWPMGLLSIDHGSTALASLVGLSNLNLLSQSLDYFGNAAAQNPFTHTWSLGVEEQFYLLFPLLIARPRWLIALITSALGLWLTLQVQQPETAFYLMPTRFWELGLGILLWRWQKQLSKSPWIGGFGLTALITSLAMPLSWQLVSTPLAVSASAALVLGLEAKSSLRRLFQWKPFSDIGKRAYGLYLWHWPLLVFAHSLFPINPWLHTGLPLAITVVMAWASYRFLEVPLRKGTWGFKEGLPIVGACGGLVAIFMNLAQQSGEGENYEFFAKRHREDLQNQPCHSSKRKDALVHCLPVNHPSTAPRVILLGDSHIAHLQPILNKQAIPFLQLSDRNLPNIWLGRSCREPAYCFNQLQVLEQLEKSLPENSLVIVGLSPRRLTGPKRSKQESATAARNLEISLKALWQLIKQRNSKLLLIGGLPQVHCPPGQSFKGLFNRGGNNAVNQACGQSKEMLQRQNKPLMSVYQKLRNQDPVNIKIMKTSSLFCNEDRCSLTNEDGELLMWDELAHLTPEGLQRLEPTLLQTLQELLPKGDNEKL